MKKQMRLLCCLLFAAFILTSIPTFSSPRDYAYVLEETIWEMQRNNARAELETAWEYFHRPYRGSFLPDSIVSDSIIPDIRLVEGGILHRITHIQDGKEDVDYYYEDGSHYYLHVIAGVYTNCGQPWSPNEYYYISRDGIITFNTCKYIEILLWCGNVFLSPLLWVGVLLFFLMKWMKHVLLFFKKES